MSRDLEPNGPLIPASLASEGIASSEAAPSGSAASSTLNPRLRREPEAEPASLTRRCDGTASSVTSDEANLPHIQTWGVQSHELSVRMRGYTERSTATELFELADQSRLRASMRCGYVECAQCARSFLDTAQLDGRCEVKVLPCFHCICAPCLQAALSDSNATAISCPICSRSCKRMPLHKFLPHFEVHSLRDGQQIASRDFMCEECISANRAENYCEHCVMNLCSDCSRQHRRSKATVRHKLVSLNEREEVGGSMLQRHRALYCAVHRNACYKLFCEDCDTIICYQCATESHQTHSYKLPTDSLVERHRGHINDLLDRLGSQLSDAQELQKSIHRGLSELGTASAELSEDVNCAFDDLLAAAEDRCSELLSPLQEDCRKWRDSLLAERSECSKALVDIWRTINFLEKVITRGTDIEVLKVRGQLFKEWHQVKQLQSWRELGQRPDRSVWYEGDVHAGWRSALEADHVLRLLCAAGAVEAAPPNSSDQFSAPLPRLHDMSSRSPQPQAVKPNAVRDGAADNDSSRRGGGQDSGDTGETATSQRGEENLWHFRQNRRRWQQLDDGSEEGECEADDLLNWYGNPSSSSL